MRIFQMGLALSAALLLSSVVNAQGGRPGLGGIGQGARTAADLVQREDVKKELKVSEEQAKKIPEAMSKALADVLDTNQMKRLRQIELQQKGINALKDEGVQKSLKLSSEQKESINTILEDLTKETKELFKDKKGFNKEAFQKVATLRKEAKEKAEGVLKDDQKTAYKELLGEEFKLQQGFRPGGGAGGTNSDNPQIRRRPGQQPGTPAQPKKKVDA